MLVKFLFTQMGLLKWVFNYGTLIIKARGDVIEKIYYVKNPSYYRQEMMR